MVWLLVAAVLLGLGLYIRTHSSALGRDTAKYRAEERVEGDSPEYETPVFRALDRMLPRGSGR